MISQPIYKSSPRARKTGLSDKWLRSINPYGLLDERKIAKSLIEPLKRKNPNCLGSGRVMGKPETIPMSWDESHIIM